MQASTAGLSDLRQQAEHFSDNHEDDNAEDEASPRAEGEGCGGDKHPQQAQADNEVEIVLAAHQQRLERCTPAEVRGVSEGGA